MTAEPESDVLGAALIQISTHAERITTLDTREAHHYEQIADHLRNLATDISALGIRIDGADSAPTQQSAILTSLNALDQQVTALAEQLAKFADEGENEKKRNQYQPVSTPRWWKLTGPEREGALDRLRAWVEHIYRPSYGHLAAALPSCWEQHPLCLYTLDWLSELWSILYLSSSRTSSTLAAQGEWHTRLLPAAANHMQAEADKCPHSRDEMHS